MQNACVYLRSHGHAGGPRVGQRPCPSQPARQRHVQHQQPCRQPGRDPAAGNRQPAGFRFIVVSPVSTLCCLQARSRAWRIQQQRKQRLAAVDPAAAAEQVPTSASTIRQYKCLSALLLGRPTLMFAGCSRSYVAGVAVIPENTLHFWSQPLSDTQNAAAAVPCRRPTRPRRCCRSWATGTRARWRRARRCSRSQKRVPEPPTQSRSSPCRLRAGSSRQAGHRETRCSRQSSRQSLGSSRAAGLQFRRPRG